MTLAQIRSFLVFSAVFLLTGIHGLAQGGQGGGRNDGAQLFASNCAGCHGADGKGSAKGVAIATLPAVIALSDADLASVVHSGKLTGGMPAFPQLSDRETQAVVRYLRTLQGVTSPGTSAAITGDADAGKTIFFGKGQCSSCHMLNGQGGFIASDMTAYGQSRTANVILKAIVTPDSQLAPASRLVEVKTKAGQKLVGVVRSEDNLHLALQTEDGQYHFLTRQNLAEVNYTDHSLMPHDYGTRLTGKELDDLVSFLIVTGKNAPPEAAPTGRGRRGGGN
jgi:cytochrome c oxidase cbb3-type subunit III